MLGQLLRRREPTTETETRYTLDDISTWFAYNGYQYHLGGTQTTLGGRSETIGPGYESCVHNAYAGNGIVFACVAARMMVFSEARFAYQQFRDGRPGDLFSKPALDLLNDASWLLPRLEQDASLAGNAYVWNNGGRLEHLRPDWVTVILTERPAIATRQDIAGYHYWPEGPGGSAEAVTLDRSEVAHYAPIPDPLAQFRGMAWLTPVLREITADTEATKFKASYFENGATPNMVVKFDAEKTLEQVREFRDLWNEQHQGAEQAFKTAFLGGGADPAVIGSNLDQANLKNVQGAGETRIAVAAGVPAVFLGISEGMQGSSLNAGNYGQARRRFSDGTIRPLWKSAAQALSVLVPDEDMARLWYDDRDVKFLQEDARDDAEILSTQAVAIRQLTDAGFDADAVIAAVNSGDLRALAGTHTGLFSVQLQPPGTEATPEPEEPPERGLRIVRDSAGRISEVQ